MTLQIPGDDFTKIYNNLKDFIVYQSKSRRQVQDEYNTLYHLIIDKNQDTDNTISCSPIKFTYHFGHSIPSLYKKEDLEIYDPNKNIGFNIRISDLNRERPIEIKKFHLQEDGSQFIDSSIEFGGKSIDIEYRKDYNRDYQTQFYDNIDELLEVEPTWDFGYLIDRILSSFALYIKSPLRRNSSLQIVM